MSTPKTIKDYPITPLNPMYQMANNRQWLTDQVLGMVDALICAGEPIKAVQFIDTCLPATLEGDRNLLSLRKKIAERVAHGFDFVRFKQVYGGYASSVGAPVTDEAMLHLSRVHIILMELEKQQPKEILEIGCGDGSISNTILSSIPDAVLTIADISDIDGVLAELRKRHGADRVKHHRVDSHLYDWPSEGFDAVVAMEIIEHVIDTAAFLESCKHRMRDGSVLYISTPDADFWLERDIFHRDDKPLQHIVANTPRSLVARAEEAGLECTKIQPSIERHICATFKRKQ